MHLLLFLSLTFGSSHFLIQARQLRFQFLQTKNNQFQLSKGKLQNFKRENQRVLETNLHFCSMRRTNKLDLLIQSKRDHFQLLKQNKIMDTKTAAHFRGNVTEDMKDEAKIAPRFGLEFQQWIFELKLSFHQISSLKPTNS